ncbi:type II toxin-antitoxin system Phd/YefM family antitoxin [Agromyces silvae]|uniref:type II toxin-antitoxin system Phd/YefM family antitoxin n=1 Tax=Agromyces silvae TaxID=3388266 RepID=UPI00280B67EF|nr:type II toxin-antitoxin system Phd/YefM family antitoxin [Agromyces protaetiae]
MNDVVTISHAKQNLGALVDHAHLLHDPVFLTGHGRRVAVIVDAEAFERMVERLEDLDDAEAAHIARREMEETSALPVPWEEVKAELGLS